MKTNVMWLVADILIFQVNFFTLSVHFSAKSVNICLMNL